MPHPFFERHARRSIARCTAIAERGYWSPYPESASPKVYGEGAAEAGKAAFDALRDKPFPLDAAGHGRNASAARSRRTVSARHHLSEGRPRRAVRGDRRRRRSAGARPDRRPGSACARDPAPDQPAELPLRERRDAHDRAGVHDGIPGGRTARAGPRARGGRLRVGRDEAHSGEGALGKAAGQERAAQDGKAASASCRAASAS